METSNTNLFKERLRQPFARKEQIEIPVVNLSDLKKEDFENNDGSVLQMQEHQQKEIATEAVKFEEDNFDNTPVKKKERHTAVEILISTNEDDKENGETKTSDNENKKNKAKIIQPSRMLSDCLKNVDGKPMIKPMSLLGVCNPLQECLISGWFLPFIEAIDYIGNGRCFFKSLETVMTKQYSYNKYDLRSAVQDMEYYGLINTKKVYGNLVIELANPSLMYLNHDIENYPFVVPKKTTKNGKNNTKQTPERKVYQLSRLTEEGLKKSVCRAVLFSDYKKTYTLQKFNYLVNFQFERKVKNEFVDVPLTEKEKALYSKSLVKPTTKEVKRTYISCNTDIDYVKKLAEKNIEILFNPDRNVVFLIYFDINNSVTPAKLQEIVEQNEFLEIGVDFNIMVVVGNARKAKAINEEMKEIPKPPKKKGEKVAIDITTKKKLTKEEILKTKNQKCKGIVFINADFDKYFRSHSAKDIIEFETEAERLANKAKKLAEKEQKLTELENKLKQMQELTK